MALPIARLLISAMRTGTFNTQRNLAENWFKKSINWLVQNARKLYYEPTRFMREEGNFFEFAQKIEPGMMYTFFYDAKLKDKLPYWDRFPCIFVIEQYSDGFLGLNLHYLDYKNRAALLDALLDYQTNNNDPYDKRLKVNYSIVKGFSKSKQAKHCIKRYLTKHVKSRFMQINSNHWGTVAMLPIQMFTGKNFKSLEQVWKIK